MTPAAGTLLFSRFRVIREAGRGGMGVVLRATDQATREDVALKLLLDEDGADRFVRESQTLAEIGHPGIVRYVAHGRSDTGAPWLAMEWLEGEALADRLRRGPLPERLAVSIAKDVALALGAAHAAGIVHRDIKPGNVFLAGDPEAPRVKVLDFGIARRARADQRSLTTTGTVLGTPYYMAPEQARSDRALDARADVWSVGALTYEMLSGHRPFEHDSVVAVLAAVLLEEPVPLLERVPELSPPLTALVHRCLDKRPEHRPESGAALAEALAAIDLGARSSAPPRLGLTDKEQRVVFAVLALHAASGSDATVSDAGWSTTEAARSPEGALRAAAQGHEAKVLPLGDGALLFVLPESGTPGDQAAGAARLALALHQAVPTAALAIAGGRAELGARLPVGEVVQRAEVLAAHARSDAASAVRIDELAASLVGPRFLVERDGRGVVLTGERGDTTTGTRLATPLVGRDRELRTLADLAGEAHEEPMAKVAVVLGASGTGKSRLLAEVQATLEERAGRVVSLRGEPLHSRSPHGLIASLLRAVAGIGAGMPLEERRARLRETIARAVPSDGRSRALALLGDITRTPLPPEEADPALLGALDDAFLRGDLVVRAFTSWLGGEAARAPLSILVDDVPYVDEASLLLLDRALRGCPEAPIFLVLATRDDAASLLPEHEPTQVRLGRLSPRACRTLLDGIAPGTPEELAARILDRAEGNPLFLEEMARAARRGDALEILPTSVLAVVEDRISELAPEARRVLRAVAILGAHASPSAIAHLLAMTAPAERASIEDWLAFLLRRELLVREVAGGEPHYRFRQPVVRDAAYAMLTERDRATGHLLAAQLAEAGPEPDPDVIATHYDRAGEGARASVAYAEAAERALGAHDLAGAVARAERALALPSAAPSAGLLATLARAHRYRAEYGPAFEAARRALALTEAGSSGWLDAAGTFVSAAAQLGRVGEAMPCIDALLTLPLGEERDAGNKRALVVTTCRAGSVLLGHDRDKSRAALARAEALLSGAVDEPLARAWCEVLAASHALVDGDVGAFALGTERAVAAYERAGDARDACNQRVRLGNAWKSLGVPERAAPVLEAARADAARMGLRLVEGYALQNLGHAEARLQHTEAALRTLDAALRIAEALGDGRLEAGVRLYLAEVLRKTEPAHAEREARLAWRAVRDVPGFGAVAAAHHALTLLSIGQIEEASTQSELASAALAAQPDAFEEGEASIRRAAVEVHLARGREGAARVEARAAMRRIEARAQKIGDPALRLSFLQKVPDHLTLAEVAGPDGR